MRHLTALISLAALANCAHGPRASDPHRATASVAGVCRNDPRYKATEFASDDRARLVVYADPTQTSADQVDEIGRLAIRGRAELRRFFGIVGPEVFRIYLVADTNAFDDLAGSKTDWTTNGWIVGVRLFEGSLLLRDPRTWEAKSKSFVKLDELIKHEMAHAFTFAMNGKGPDVGCAAGDDPTNLGHWLWLEEGLASVASGQHVTWRNRAKFKFESSPHFAQISEYGNYTTAASAVEYLILKHSKERLFELIRRLPAYYSRAEHEDEVARELAAIYAPTSVTDLERGWREFALKTYRAE